MWFPEYNFKQGRLIALLVVLVAISSCMPRSKSFTPKESKSADYFQLMKLRSKGFHSAAYLIDLRINDAGRKYSVTTEAFFSGDSVAFYGRGYIGKGAFKGSIIDNVVTVYFSRGNEYYRGVVNNLDSGSECASPGEVLLYMLSIMSGRQYISREQMPPGLKVTKRKIEFMDGRFNHVIRLEDGQFPRREILTDDICQDSIVIKYGSFRRKFPFFKTEDILYHNKKTPFRARGFIREQQYNIRIRSAKFNINIPPSAELLDRI